LDKLEVTLLLSDDDSRLQELGLCQSFLFMPSQVKCSFAKLQFAMM